MLESLDSGTLQSEAVRGFKAIEIDMSEAVLLYTSSGLFCQNHPAPSTSLITKILLFVIIVPVPIFVLQNSFSSHDILDKYYICLPGLGLHIAASQVCFRQETVVSDIVAQSLPITTRPLG